MAETGAGECQADDGFCVLDIASEDQAKRLWEYVQGKRKTQEEKLLEAAKRHKAQVQLGEFKGGPKRIERRRNSVM